MNLQKHLQKHIMNIEAIQRKAAQFVEKWPGIVTGNQDVLQNYLNDLVGKPFRNQGLWSPRNFFGLHNQILLPTVSQFSVSKYTRLYLKIHKIVSQNTPDCVSKYTTLYLKIHQIVSQNTPDCISAHTHFKPFKQSAKNVPVNEGKTHAS